MQCKTLVDLIKEVRNLEDVGITFIEGSNGEYFLSYKELYNSALKTLSYLKSKGLEPKQELIIQIEDNKTFLTVFWACVMGGIIPVPLSIGQTKDQKKKVFKVWNILKDPYIITTEKNLLELSLFADKNQLTNCFSEISKKVIDPVTALLCTNISMPHKTQENDIAFIQFSSGSTGEPKGITLSHKNLFANMKGISASADYSIKDSMLSWMPLTHDMGMIGFHLNPLFEKINQFIIPTSLFIRRPNLWLEKASQHKVSILCSPNFGYRYLIKFCKTQDNYDWDLSNVRLIFNGAEPISSDLCEEFLNIFSIYGLKRSSLRPVYGLAEASLAVSISNLEDEVISLHLNRDKLKIGDKITPMPMPDSKGSISIVNVGSVINYCSVRITNKNGFSQEDETVGNIEIRGENVTLGYYNDDIASQNLINVDGWLKTGDLGFLKNGDLYVTGRAKDLIISNGQNYYPHDIEKAAISVDGIELNRIAVVGFYNTESKKEEIIAFVQNRKDPSQFIPVVNSLRSIIQEQFGLLIDRILPVKEIPKTTSGKLQRYKLLEEFEKGAFLASDLEISNLLLLKDEKVSTDLDQLNDVEKDLYMIWKLILDTDNFGTDVSFFEIGGNSLKAAEMSMLVNKTLEVELGLNEIYDKKTIKELARGIEYLKKKEYVPIPNSNKKRRYFPLSSSQRSLYYFWELDKSSIVYNVPIAMKFDGFININRLEECINKLIVHHESLRITFRRTSEPEFKINKHVNLTLNCLECERSEANEKLKSLVQPFDLGTGPLFRFKLLKLGHNEYILFADFHHIITDGISISKFLSELLDLHAGNGLEILPIKFSDYCLWENSDKKTTKSQQEYWQKQLAGDLPTLEMPYDFPRPLIFEGKGEKIEFKIEDNIVQSLKKIAKEQLCTNHVLLFSIYSLLLSKYSGQEDIIVGIPVAGRSHPDLVGLHGMFVNNLAIRTLIDGDESFLDFLSRSSKNINNAISNQDFLFEDLVKEICVKRDISRNPVFDTMFIYQNMKSYRKKKNEDYTISRHFFDPGFSKFDISLEVFDEDGLVNYSVEYCTKIFKKETILLFAKHFEILLNKITENPQEKISNLLIVTDSEYYDYARGSNFTDPITSNKVTIHKLFEKQVENTPHAVAIEFLDEKITYLDLNLKANYIANQLKRDGIIQNGVVSILLPRGMDLIICILGVLKAGGCYLTVDTELPIERIDYILTDSKSKILLTSKSQKRQIEDLKDTVINMGIIVINFDELQIENVRLNQEPNDEGDLAYVIYTSGTTGNPKGVMVEHRSLVNYTLWAAKSYLCEELNIFPLYTSVSFDLTITSIFVPLISGNKIIVYNDNVKENTLLIEKVLVDNKVTIIKLTPSHLKLVRDSKVILSSNQTSLKKLIVGGEKLSSLLAKEIYDQFNGKVEIYNEYGPTEATVGCMIHKFELESASESVPIGIPADNTGIYILDKYLKPLPQNIHGEIYIGGQGLSRGYLFQEELTEKKFIANPFVKGEKLYKTGDIAKRLSNGLIEYIGRYDDQIKINGHRVEVSEIEMNLLKHPSILEVVVVLRDNNKNQKNLCAYFKLRSEDLDFRESTLKAYLAQKLPHYMIPVHFIQIQEMPLTNNGKINIDALPDPQEIRQQENKPSPKNDVQKISIKIWEEVLCEQNLTIKDNFFELGGDSIKAVQIASRLQEKGISITVKDILTYHTIEQISSYARVTDEAYVYDQGIIEGEKRLSPIESWFFDQNFKNPDYYNQSVLLNLGQKIDGKLIVDSFKKLVEHHDTLRINYNPLKKVLFYNGDHLKEEFPVDKFLLKSSQQTSKAISQHEAIESLTLELQDSFDITKSLLIKAAIIKESSKSNFLFITAHHLIMDGVSWRILLEDLHSIYSSLENGLMVNLPRKTATLLDWERKLIEYSWAENLKNQEAYWNKIEDTIFNIPQDFETADEDWVFGNSAKEVGTLNRENTAFLIKDAHKPYKTDVPIILNAALALSLKNWLQIDKFIVEHENHGRHLDDIDVSRTLGWFTSMYPVLLELKKESSISECLKDIKEQMRSVPNNGIGYGFCKYLGGTNSETKRLTQIRFNYLGQFAGELNNKLFTFSNHMVGNHIYLDNSITTKIEINIIISNGELFFEANYNKKAFHKRTIEKFVVSFFDNLSNILSHIRDEDEIHFTPSDFDAVDLNEEELNALF